ncbi:MAG: TRAP transporter fused permease subunit [Deltaproteobacteria bacterium]|nr:TRAP transporter fused permease subunit [Deltaproteobacteria bacterium]
MENKNVIGIAEVVLAIISIVAVVYHMIAAHTIIQEFLPLLNTHLAFCLVLVFLSGFVKARGKGRVWCLVLLLLSLIAVSYIYLFWQELQMRAFFNTRTDLIIGVLLIVLVIEGTRQSFGLVMPIIVSVIILYPFIGGVLPEPFFTRSLSLPKTIANLSVGLQGAGIYGTFLSASIYYVFLFVIFGALLQATGGTAFFESFARLVAGRLQGGPALMSVVSSALAGSLTGSTITNVALTGSFTIPLMKSVGYEPEQAGAVESAASNGGGILPPVMGVGAFLMAGMTDIPYVQICAMAVVPAIIYYLTVGTYVYLRAGQLRIPKQTTEGIQKRELLLESPKFLVPFLMIVVLLISGYTVMFTAFWAVIGSVAVSLIRKKTRPSLGQFITGFTKGAVSGGGVGLMTACIALLGSTFTMTGLGVKLSYSVEVWSGGHMFLALLIIWAVSVVVGMGGIGFAAYLVVSMFAVPALVNLGVPFAQAHFFIYFACLFSGVTPPVAIAAVVASRIAGASYLKTAIESGKIAAAGLLLPLMMVHIPIIMLQPVEPLLEFIKLVVFLISLLILQVSFVGYYVMECSLWEKIVAATGALMLLLFIFAVNYLLFLAGIILFALLSLMQWRKRRKGVKSPLASCL